VEKNLSLVILCLVFGSLLALACGLDLEVVYSSEPEVEASPTVQPQRFLAKDQSEKQLVKLNFDDVDIPALVKFISEVTGKNFAIDPKVKGKVTIVSPTKISVDEAYQVFESVLEVHGYTTVPAGSIIKIVPSSEARGKAVETELPR
jgi:general secretion pathway protein D